MVFSPFTWLVLGEEYHAFLFSLIFSATLRCNTNDDNTTLSGDIIDQAALHGVFKKIRNLGLTIISVNPQAKGE
jgi:hypothetical protein